MPQLDLETLVRCGSGSKISCETLIEPDPNLPPESITLPLSSLDLAVISYDRDDSAKESTNPKSQNPNPNLNNNFYRSGSQRYAKANGPILSLPNKIKHVSCTSRRNTSTTSRIFPKKKKSGTVFEPSSPKVSCFGKVLSDRERSGHRKGRSRERNRCFLSFLICGGKEAGEAKEECDDLARNNIPVKKRNVPPTEEVSAPGLGGMKRFASGRRTASWGGEVEGDGDGHVLIDLRRRSLDGGGTR